jgi:DNA phosphorothioation-dependent restriction protein DptH
MDAEAADEARRFLETLEGGYVLRFTRSALVFDFDKPGTEPPDNEVGIEFHRVGNDLIRALVYQLAPQPSTLPSTEGSSEDGAGAIAMEGMPPSNPPIPRLDAAAFLVAKRQRATTIEQGRDEERVVPLPAAIVDVGTTPGPLASPPAGKADRVEPTVTQTFSQAAAKERADLSPAAPRAESAKAGVAHAEPPYDIILGVTRLSPQFGLLGEAAGRKVALDLNQTHTISLFGVQGGGKSYTLGSVIEMACMPIPGINVLPRPLAAVIFHYSSTLDYKPEFTSMVAPNTDDVQVQLLRGRFGAQPRGLEDVVILTPAAKVAERVAEYPGMKVLPISFKSSELKAAHWKFLMGAVGSQSMYIRQVGLIMKKLRDDLTLSGLRRASKNLRYPII